MKYNFDEVIDRSHNSLQMHNVPAAAYYENGQVERIEESL